MGPDAGLRGYLVSNRDFLDPVVAQAIAELGSWPGGRALEVGTGAGGALPHLARAVGPGGTVLGVDVNAAVLPLATEHVEHVEHAEHAEHVEHAERGEVTGRVELRAADATDVAARERFDLIWAGESIWPGAPSAPTVTVAALAGALRPRGVLALFYSNYYRSIFLPGRTALERTLRAASELRWGLPPDGEQHTERHVGWLRDAGLVDVALRVLPRAGFPIADDPAARSYLESAVWPEFLQSAAERGAEVGLTDLDPLRELLTPGSGRYVLDDPGYYLLHPTVLATGRAPGTWRSPP